MIRIAANNIDKYYGANKVLDGLTFEIFQGEKVGILGPNGAGKSTLLKVLTQTESIDSGELFLTRGVKIGALDQMPTFPEGWNVRTCLLSAFQNLIEIKNEMTIIEEKLLSVDDKQLLKKYGELSHAFEHGGGYEIESAIEDIQTGFNIDEHMLLKQFEQLSGGEKTRVAMATMLLTPQDVIILDEPTNHLDLNRIEWLESYIKKYSGTVIVISHDRYFLNQIADRIIEISKGKAFSFTGNYNDYAKQKEILIRQQEEKYEQEQKKIKQLEEAAKRMHEWAQRADSTAMHRRAFSVEKRIERMDQTEKPQTERKLTAKFDSEKAQSKEMLRLIELSKAYGKKQLLNKVTLTLFKHQQIALVGDNGVGKSTLLKILCEELNGDSGDYIWSPSVKYGYLPQEIEFIPSDLTVLEWLKGTLEIDEETARGLLAKYKFIKEDVFKPLSGLSGGEKTRLKLCELMQKKVNFLLLDEPTNHLDIPSREWVEDALAQFEGTLLFVSHDRHFIDKFANLFWHLEGGKINAFEGNYDAYRAVFKNRDNIQQKKAKAIGDRSTEKNESESNKSESNKSESNSASSDVSVQLDKNKKNFAKINLIELEIESLEQALQNVESQINEFSDDYEKLQSLLTQRSSLKEVLNTQYELWEKYNI
ncbi:ABC-F type ribosomal protection protein [Fusibacter bizertensis]|uniref:ABC-F type ribosomal protection protein n=1 Tax=Fusibacter bizertensis TaxID=1488331 RepID=A0ABT6N8L2_9FIRM|nr:ABC-F type ribosomal protection protein [Fusibacter bizertensis]MDH8676745.1 ABC-F type ribosomal protection protein [Fusibacter bizertensis]